VVGELCILDLKPRSVTVVALEDSVIGVLPHERFAALLDDHPKIGVRLLKGMLLRVSIRLRKSFDRLADVF
jgi:CRP-like cAMP-binding protein